MKTKKLTLALGEGSHTHIMHSDVDIEYQIENDDKVTFLLKSAGIITHEEHDRIVLPQGEYVKYPQMEYDPFRNEIRRVFD